VNDDQTYNIKYDDGDASNHFHADRVRGRHSGGGGAATQSSGNAPCPGPGLTRRCSGVCVNIQEDNNNCGSCGNRCQSGKHCDGHMSCRDANGDL
jgi:Stigma-specific protein, Stig1